MKYLIGLFLIVHGLIHMAFVAPVPNDPNYPFTLTKSWLSLPAGILKPLGITLVVLSVLGFLLAGLSYLGWLVPADWFRVLAIVSSVASFLLIGIFWHNSFIFGILIDVAILGWVLFKLK